MWNSMQVLFHLVELKGFIDQKFIANFHWFQIF